MTDDEHQALIAETAPSPASPADAPRPVAPAEKKKPWYKIW